MDVVTPDVRMEFDPEVFAADVRVASGDLVGEPSLETAIILSLFTRRRAAADDELPAGETDRGGWWADAYLPDEGDQVGSRLWLLSRELETAETLARAKEYVEEALAWMVEDQVAREVQVETEITRPGVLGIAITVVRPDGSLLPRRFDLLWEALG